MAENLKNPKNAPAKAVGALSPAPTEFREILVICALLAGLTFFVFLRVTGFEFISFDDPDFVTSNPHVQNGFSGEELKWAFTSMFNYWQPLVWLSYMLDFRLFGLSVAAFHFSNLLLHVINTVLVFLVFRRMTKNHWASALVAGLFAFHPLHVEAVAWISERKGLLSMTFWLLTMLCYARYTERRSLLAYGLALLAFVGGLMSKSMIVTLPCVLLLMDFWPLQRWQPWKTGLVAPASIVPWWKIVLEKVPFFVLAGLSSLLTMQAQRVTGTVWSYEQLPMSQRIGHMLVEYVVYLRKIFWPNDLAVFYPYPAPWPAWRIGGAVFILAGITIGTLLWMRKRPYLVVGWLWFLGTLFPVMGLFQVGEAAMADRYTYVALSGIAIMVIWGGAEAAQRLRLPSWGQKAAALGMGLACIVTASAQLRYWQNSRTLFEHTAEVTGPNYLAYAVLGNAMAQEGRYQEAMEYFRSSLALQPRHPDTLFAAGNACFQARNFKEAAEYFQRVVDGRPNFMEGHFHLALALQAQGLAEGAIVQYKKALELQPGVARGYVLLGGLLEGQGKLDEALAQYKEAVRWKPDYPEALNRLAWVLVTHPEPAKRNGQEALRLASQACQLTQNQDLASLNALAGAYSELGDFAQALQITGKAMELAQGSGKAQLIEATQKLQKLYQEKRPCRELK